MPHGWGRQHNAAIKHQVPTTLNWKTALANRDARRLPTIAALLQSHCSPVFQLLQLDSDLSLLRCYILLLAWHLPFTQVNLPLKPVWQHEMSCRSDHCTPTPTATAWSCPLSALTEIVQKQNKKIIALGALAAAESPIDLQHTFQADSPAGWAAPPCDERRNNYCQSFNTGVCWHLILQYCRHHYLHLSEIVISSN